MADAKRPYREPASVRERPTPPKGPLVRRPEEPEDDRRRPMAKAPTDPEAGVFSGMVSPHPASTNGEWWAQVVLTTIGLPLLVATFVCVGWLDTRRAWNQVSRGGYNAPSPVGIAHPLMWCFGAAPLVLAGLAADMHPAFVGIVVGVPFVALFVRRRVFRAVVEREALEEMLRRRRAARS